jgi:hypothetical protein
MQQSFIVEICVKWAENSCHFEVKLMQKVNIFCRENDKIIALF